jgi:hypothetical protein
MKLLALGALIVLLGGPAAATDKLDDTFQSLKDAVAKKDAVQVKKLTEELNLLVQQELAGPAPADEQEKKAWTGHIDYVKSIGEYCEYALYATAIQSPPAQLVDLIAALEKMDACSKYLDGAYSYYFVALNKTGGASKIPAIAEEALKMFPDNEDLLLVAMENALNRKQADRALTFANRLTAALPRRSKPEGLPLADWERKRSAAMGRAYWVAGVISADKGSYAAADKSLRLALPLIKGDAAELGPALFYLGTVNYQLGKMTLNKKLVLEAAQFSEQAAAIPGQYADQARHNALVMKSETDRMR